MNAAPSTATARVPGVSRADRHVAKRLDQTRRHLLNTARTICRATFPPTAGRQEVLASLRMASAELVRANPLAATLIRRAFGPIRDAFDFVDEDEAEVIFNALDQVRP